MGFLDILFGGGKKKVSKETAETRGDHMPDLNIPVDEKFTIHFKQNGGKFIYCDSDNEVSRAIQNIVTENNWENEPFFVLAFPSFRLADRPHNLFWLESHISFEFACGS